MTLILNILNNLKIYVKIIFWIKLSMLMLILTKVGDQKPRACEY